MMQQWVHRMCVLYGTRLLLYKGMSLSCQLTLYAIIGLYIRLLTSNGRLHLDKARRSDPNTLQLARGIVEQAKIKGRDLCLKLTSTLDKVKIIYLSFHDQREYEKWYTRCKKVRYTN